jgi:hypothetical protein
MRMSLLLPAIKQCLPAVADVFADTTATRGVESNALASIGHAPEGLRHLLARLDAYPKYRAALPERLCELSNLRATHGVGIESPAALKKNEQDGQKSKARIQVQVSFRLLVALVGLSNVLPKSRHPASTRRIRESDLVCVTRGNKSRRACRTRA